MSLNAWVMAPSTTPSASAYPRISPGLVLCLKMTTIDRMNPTIRAGNSSAPRFNTAVSRPATTATPSTVAVLVTTSSSVMNRFPATGGV